MIAPIEWDDGPTTVRHVAAGAAVGVGFLLVGPAAWLRLPASGDATLVTGYLTLLGLPFAVPLFRYALVA